MATPEADEFLLPDLDGLEEKELRDLVERAARINELTLHPGWSYLVDYLTALTVIHQKRILGGRCDTIDEYRYQVGLVEGLRSSLEAPQRLADRVARIQRMKEIEDTERSDLV